MGKTLDKWPCQTNFRKSAVILELPLNKLGNPSYNYIIMLKGTENSTELIIPQNIFILLGSFHSKGAKNPASLHYKSNLYICKQGSLKKIVNHIFSKMYKHNNFSRMVRFVSLGIQVFKHSRFNFSASI